MDGGTHFERTDVKRYTWIKEWTDRHTLIYCRETRDSQPKGIVTKEIKMHQNTWMVGQTD